MLRRAFYITFDLALAWLLVLNSLLAQNASSSPTQIHCKDLSPAALAPALERIRVLIEDIRASYPELSATKIQLRPFESDSDFFRSHPRIQDFFLRRKLRFVMQVNPRACELNAPRSGLEAILAHELAHIAYLEKGNRLRLLSMVRLLSKNFVRDFERRTDLEAISRGYGEGLKVYRHWLYQHIPQKYLPEKRRNYLSPAEIESILQGIRQCPHLLDSWTKKPPRNLQEIHIPHSCDGTEAGHVEGSAGQAYLVWPEPSKQVQMARR